tara:strand:- start:2630 stop:3637 length:1008 start_codon:yes stop_codon:yes gene_type:complete
MTTALVDADIIAFKSAIAVEGSGDDLVPAKEEDAFAYAEVMLREWIRPVKPTKTILCFSDVKRKYFRHDIYPEYKMNRKESKRPMFLASVRDYLQKKHSWSVLSGLEADDLLGIYGTHPDIPDPVVISIDKDMYTLPVKFFNPDKMKRWIRINKAQADITMLEQSIMGDSTDNYKGIPGVGKVGAHKITNTASSPQQMWANVVQAFLDNGLTQEYAITMIRLARILRYEDYNFNNGEVRLWHPNNLKAEWIQPSALNTINSETEFKLSTTSKQSRKPSKVTKPSNSQTSSSTSVDTEVKEKPSTISTKLDGISTDSSPSSSEKKWTISEASIDEQ